MSLRTGTSYLRLAEMPSWWLAFLFLAALVLGTPAASAAAPDSVQFTLEGCRNNGNITFPANGPFICPNTAYTTGNLGKGWNELDLVPHRVTAQAGNSAPASQTYTFAVVLDDFKSDFGYDVLSAPVKNAALSAASCAVSVGSEETVSPGLGGVTSSRYRYVTVTQSKNTTCVVDFYGRLAVGSHNFDGSSLHANLALPAADPDFITTSGIGSKEVSIPVKEISPQSINKTMDATQGGDHSWTVAKEASPANVAFGDVCAADFTSTKPVQITVKWTKLDATPGKITVVAQIFATNPAAREITVTVQDKLYAGSTQTTLLHTTNLSAVDVPANTANKLVGTDTVELDPVATGLVVGDYVNDVATATYTDKVTGVPVPGNTTAVALAQIAQGSTGGDSAAVRDSESITGTGLTFSVATPSVGAFNGYTADTPTTGPVKWGSGLQTDTGSVTFDKTIQLAGKIVTSGVLSDQAFLLATNGFTTKSSVLSINVSSTAFVKLTISKTIPDVLDGTESVDVAFKVTRASDATYEENATLTFTAGGLLTKSTVLTGLVPDTYTVTEGKVTFHANAADITGTEINTLVPIQGTKNVDLTVTSQAANCTGTASFANVVNTATLATARVAKITQPTLDASDPDFNWTFTLTGPGGVNESKTAVTAGGPYVGFTSQLLSEGSYTITETGKPKWDLTAISASASDGTTSLAQSSCSFTVDYPEDAGQQFSCTFTNTKRGKAKVIKTVKDAVPSGTQAFTFQLRQGATTSANGTTLESLVANAGNGGVLNFTTQLVAGTTYQLCEIVMPGWLTTLGNFVPNSFMPPDGVAANPNVDNSILCGNFTVQPGETKTFTIDNTPPPGGRALTIGFWKNWASCSGSSGKQKPVLDQTLASFPIASGESTHGVYIGDLYVDTCREAVALLNKSTLSGKKMASDPAFNMAAQLMAAQLNVQAGAGLCPAAATAINQAQGILDAAGFNGNSYNKTGFPAGTANSLATTLDLYNNNKLCN